MSTKIHNATYSRSLLIAAIMAIVFVVRVRTKKDGLKDIGGIVGAQLWPDTFTLYSLHHHMNTNGLNSNSTTKKKTVESESNSKWMGGNLRVELTIAMALAVARHSHCIRNYVDGLRASISIGENAKTHASFGFSTSSRSRCTSQRK